MKRKLLYGLALAAGIAMFSCTNAPKFENAVYITGTEASATRSWYIDGVPSEIGFSATLADLYDARIEVEMEVDNSLIEPYNKKYNKAYQAMPAGSYVVSALNLTIEPQELRSNSSKIEITDDSGFQEGVSYLIPLTIKRVRGGVRLLEASKTVYFVVNKTLHTKALNLRGSISLLADFAAYADASLTALPGATMETRFRCNSLQSSDPYINSIMGLEENFLIRIGNAARIEKNQIQEAKSSSTATQGITLGEWYHVAAVFENGVVRLYLNGNLEAQGTSPKGALMNLTDVYSDPSFAIGQSAKSRRFNGYISEMRVWKKALTRAEIVNNMCYVDPTTEGLLAYWRFDGSMVEGTTNTVLDHTGNGYNAVANYTLSATDWVDVACP